MASPDSGVFMVWGKEDLFFMRRCLLLAKKGEGKVSPNPMVGAVLARNGRIIGEGFHGRFGSPHAEVNAIQGKNCPGATLYVSLEPCSHSSPGKKTPPCAPMIVSSGIRRAVIATPDPNPKVSGRGIALLRKAGIKVDVGILSSEAEELNESFFKFMETDKPFVALKMAQSADGKIGVRGKGGVRISGKEFNRYAQRLRNRYDAILAGIGTVLADDPRLTCRMGGGRNPARIVLDSHLRIPLSARVLSNAKKERVIVATSARHGLKKAKALRGMGVKVIVCGKRRPSLRALFSRLPPLGIMSVLVEGGATIAEAALSEKLADRAIICMSRKKLGEKNTVPSPFSKPGWKRLLSSLKKTRMGRDTAYEGRL